MQGAPNCGRTSSNRSLTPVERLVHSRDALVAFIRMSCAIDSLAGFWWDRSMKS